MSKPMRAVLTKLGLDSHEVGVKLVARYLRDAGFEVIYMGPYNAAEAIVRTVIDESADLLGFSVLTLGNHAEQVAKIMNLLKKEGADDVVVFGGGILPPEDIEAWKAAGVRAVYPPGTLLPKVVEEMREAVRKQRAIAA